MSCGGYAQPEFAARADRRLLSGDVGTSLVYTYATYIPWKPACETRAPFASYIVATAESAKVNPHLVPSYVGKSATQKSRWFTSLHGLRDTTHLVARNHHAEQFSHGPRCRPGCSHKNVNCRSHTAEEVLVFCVLRRCQAFGDFSV